MGPERSPPVRINLARVLELLRTHITATLCQTVFASIRTNKRQRCWTLGALVHIWLAVILRAPRVCASLAAPIRSIEEFEDRNTIKVGIDRRGDALYFSREPIPTRQRLLLGKFPACKQVCIIPFRRDLLLTYTALEPMPIEQAESIDMLRALEHGYPIRPVKSDHEIFSEYPGGSGSSREAPEERSAASSICDWAVDAQFVSFYVIPYVESSLGDY